MVFKDRKAYFLLSIHGFKYMEKATTLKTKTNKQTNKNPNHQIGNTN